MMRLARCAALVVTAVGMLSARPVQAGEKRALLIGVRQYVHKQLRNLEYAEADIIGLGAVLQDSGYRPEHIKLMTQTLAAHDPLLRPSGANIRKELSTLLSNCGRDDTVLIGFAGHGIQFRGAEQAYFCPMDADLDNRTTLIGLKEVFQKLQQCKAQLRLFIVDACRNDPQVQSRLAPFGPGALPVLEPGPNLHQQWCMAAVPGRPEKKKRRGPVVDLESVTRPQDRLPPRGVVALYSCSAGQLSFESDRLKHGVFFNFALEGLRGKADLDGDSNITLEELELYTAQRVKAFVRKEYEADQVPCHSGEAPSGLVIVSLTATKPVTLGISVQDVTLALARRLGLKNANGVEIQGVLPGLAGAKADLRPGDVLLRLNDKTIEDGGALEARLARQKPGDTVTVDVVRSTARLRIPVVLEARLAREEMTQRYLTEARRGQAWAQYEISQRYALGRGMAIDRREAFAWCRRAAEKGFALAQNSLGQIYRDGDFGAPQDAAEAAVWYRRAAEQGDPNAQDNLGNLYQLGEGVGLDYGEAAKWLRQAAEAGHSLAQFSLGGLYLTGRGLDQDDGAALVWFRKAAAAGLAAAERSVGLMYRLGRGVARDDREALQWYRQAAEHGDLDAQFNLGNMYRNGWGTEKDLVQAVGCYRLAAERGLAESQFMLGMMYANGWGVAKDYREAVESFRSAASQELPIALRYMGIMYQNGYGVERSLDRAVEWYRKAADKGDREAQRRLNQLGVGTSGPSCTLRSPRAFALGTSRMTRAAV